MNCSDEGEGFVYIVLTKGMVTRFVLIIKKKIRGPGQRR